MCGLGNRQRLAQAGMRQNEVVVDVEQRQLMLQPSSPWHSVLTRRPIAATCWRISRLSPFHERGVDLPATGSQDLFDRIQRADYYPVLYPHHALTPVLLDDLRIK